MNSLYAHYLASMFVEVHTPEHLTGQQLDSYLAQGWFRMGQTVFTTNFAHVKDQMLSTIWLRVLLHDYQKDALHRKLLKQHEQFTTSIQLAVVNEEKEMLYARYRASLPFSPSETLQHLLFGKGDHESIYNTYEVTVRDGDVLIACGFFDLGGESAQGIVSFYDPAYKKHSPGKWLIYSKIQYCKDLGLKYFYPGYFVPGNPYFDYKLRIASAALEFLALSSNTWNSISSFTENIIPIRVMQTKLDQLSEKLKESGMTSSVLKYEFFDAGLIPEMRDSGLLDFPVFLRFGEHTEDPVQVMAVFDVRDNHYYLHVCAPVFKPDRTNPDTSFYSHYFLKPVQEIYATENPEDLVALLIALGRRNAFEPRS